MSQQGQVGSGTFSARLKLAAVMLACSLATLVSATVLLSRQSQLVQGIIRHQTRPTLWQAELPAVRVGLLEAEAGARGYLASRDAVFLWQYQSARQTLPTALQALDGATATDPTLSPVLDDIRRLVGLKLAELGEVVRLAQAGDTQAALVLVKADTSRSLDARIQSGVEAVADAVRAHHDTSAAEVIAGSLETQRLASVTLGVLLIAVVLAAWQITKMTAAQERNERALAQSEQRHRAIVEDQTEFIALSHLDGSLFYVNPAYERFFDIPPEELGGGVCMILSSSRMSRPCARVSAPYWRLEIRCPSRSVSTSTAVRENGSPGGIDSNRPPTAAWWCTQSDAKLLCVKRQRTICARARIFCPVPGGWPESGAGSSICAPDGSIGPSTSSEFMKSRMTSNPHWTIRQASIPSKARS